MSAVIYAIQVYWKEAAMISTLVFWIIVIRDYVRIKRQNKTAVIVELDYKYVIQRLGDGTFVSDLLVGDVIYAQKFRTQQEAETEAKNLGFKRILIHPRPR